MYNNNQELDAMIEEVRRELRSMLIKRRKLIQKLGYAFERVVANPESICEEIKTSLRDEIVDKTISSRDIERYCLDKWKKKTKPQKNDKLSFSDKLEQENQKKVVIDTQGASLQESNITSHSANIGDEKGSTSERRYNQCNQPIMKLPHISEMSNNSLCEIEYSLPFKVIQSYASSAFRLNNGIDKLWFNCVVDMRTAKVLSAGIGRLNERTDNNVGAL